MKTFVSLLLFLLLVTATVSAADANAVRRLRSEFRNPSQEFTQAPFWFWNGEISEDGIRRQLDDMQAKGVHGFVIHARMGLSKKVGYLTPRWLELVKFAIGEAERRRMIVYLYDEGMYPSGSAHGEVVNGRPDLASQGLSMEKGEVAPADDVVAVRDGYTFRLKPSGGVIRGVHLDEEDSMPGAPKSADLLNADATARFIRFTHDRYREAVGEHFGKTVRGIFTDEPSILGRRAQKGLRPWTKGLLPRITEIVGYDFAPYLHLLWEESPDGMHEVIRTDYRRAVATVLAGTYYRPISEWCERNGLALTGHPEGGGDLPPQRYFHQPGQDIVWRWVLPGETAVEGEQSLTGKTASS
ncbi:MAG: hypothetical protein GY953_39975, partial [bacterium]|nr:hypothetical protein [bacterium]